MAIKNIVTTLPVRNLERALAFYRDGLGWETDGIDEGTLMFELPSLSLFFNETDQFNHYTEPAGVKALDAGSSVEALFSCAFEKQEMVDDLLKKAAEAGGEVTAAQELDGSYTGYFRDLDGHLWQLIWNNYTAARS